MDGASRMWGDGESHCSTAPFQFDFPSSEGTSLRSAHHKQRAKKWFVAKPGCTERLWPNLQFCLLSSAVILYCIPSQEHPKAKLCHCPYPCNVSIPPLPSNSSSHSDTALPLFLFQLIQQLNLLLLHHIHQGSCSLEVSFCLRDILQQKKSPNHKS